MGMQTIGRTFTSRPAQYVDVFQHKTFQFNGKHLIEFQLCEGH